MKLETTLEGWRVKSLSLMQDVRQNLDALFRSSYANHAMRGIVLRSLVDGGMRHETLKRLWLADNLDNIAGHMGIELVSLNDIVTDLYLHFRVLSSEEDKAYFLYIFAFVLTARLNFDERFKLSSSQMFEEIKEVKLK